MGKHELSLEMQQKALAIMEAAHGVGHIATATTIRNIGVTKFNMGDYPAALAMYEKCLRIEQAAYGTGAHPETAVTMKKIERVRARMGS